MAGVFQNMLCASADEVRCEMRQACFDYLSLGGAFASGPVALLSGLNPSPWALTPHLLLGAIQSMGRLLLPFPSPKRIWFVARFIAVCHLVSLCAFSLIFLFTIVF